MSVRIRLGTSACLLGHPVHFDGSHKSSTLCRDTLAKHFELASVCPACAMGLRTPRPPIRLVDDSNSPRAIVPLEDDRDLTEALAAQALSVPDNLSGFILSHSAPCGLAVRLYQRNGRKRKETSLGPFARALRERFPDLPLEEERNLHDPITRENFINRVYVYERWKKIQTDGITAQKLLDFHAHHKYLLMATNPHQQKELGRLLSNIGSQDLPTLAADYFSQLMHALAYLASRGTHCNTMLHLSGYLRPYLDKSQGQQLRELIEQYQQGKVPLTEPLGLLRDYFNRHPDSYIQQQYYLQPYPDELCLRNNL